MLRVVVMSACKQLLLVDDDKHAREGYQAYLSGHGFNVHAFEGGIDAMAAAKAEAPDIVVLDLELPDVDGWEVARRLKSDARTRNVPIIAFSGRSMHHEQVSALRAGCDVYLSKPCAPARLLGAIHKLLGLPSDIS
jgi:twitching motility two-component system response regulator PilH